MANTVTANPLFVYGSNPQQPFLPHSVLSLQLVVHARTRRLRRERQGEISVLDDSRTIKIPRERSLPVADLADPGTMRRVLCEALGEDEESLDQLASHLVGHVVSTGSLRLMAEIELLVDMFEDPMIDAIERLKESGAFYSEGRELGTCSVCLEDLSGRLIRTHCSHHYHESCIVSWLKKKKNSCPLCRRPII